MVKKVINSVIDIDKEGSEVIDHRMVSQFVFINITRNCFKFD